MRHVMLMLFFTTTLGAQTPGKPLRSAAKKSTGWQLETHGSFEPQQMLSVSSEERHAADLLVSCGDDGPMVAMMVIDNLSTFAGSDYALTTRARAGDSTIVTTDWGETDLDAVGVLGWGTSDVERLLQQLGVARTFQVELRSGKHVGVATFKIPNHEVLERFVATCPKGASGMVPSGNEVFEGASGMVPTGNEVFMEAIVEEKPAVLSGPTLQFPEPLRQAGIEGRVLVQAIVDTLGRAEPNSVKVLQSPNPGFDQSAMNYVLKALFRPARVHGRAVRVLIQIPVDFRKH